MAIPTDQHIDTDETDLAGYRDMMERAKSKLGNTGSRRLDTTPRDSNPYKLVTTKSPAMANTIRIGWNNAAGRPVYEFRQSGVTLAVLDTGVVGNEALEATLKGFYSMLNIPAAKGDIMELWPRVQITFEPETAKDIDTQTGVVRTLRNVVTALELLPLDDKDRSAYFVQELKALARERGLLTSDAYPVIRAHVIDKGRRATQTDYEAARTALNALATKKEEDKLSKPKPAEYQSPSVANAGADQLPVFNPQPETLEDALPRDEQGKPVEVDELTGKDDSKPEPKHWANEGWWNAKLNKEIKALSKDTAIMSDVEWRKVARELLSEALHTPIASFKDVDPTKLDGESALKAISAESKLRYGVKPPEPEQKIVRRSDPATKDIPYWENPEAIGYIKNQLIATGFPEELGIAPSDVMTAAYKTAGVKDMAEWAQGGGNTGKMFYQYVVKKWEAEVKALEVPFDVEPEQPTQAPSAPVEPPTTPDAPQTTHSAPAVNGNGQSLKPVEMKPVPTQSQALVIPNTGIATLPMVAQWEIMRQQADVLIKSGFLPQSVRTPEQAITIMMMGNALSIEPIVALNSINVIQGKPTVSPQLMLALVRRSGQLESMEVTDDGDTCTVKMKRRNEPTHVETFSRKDADAMGLSKKDNWTKQPATMRKWRAIAAACRVVFPDCIWGIASYTTEEIDPDTVVIDAA